MSEYQYYEFQALERTLTNADHDYLKKLSSRVELTATNAQFVYNYGDFRRDPLQVLERCFDLMLYVTNRLVRNINLWEKKMVGVFDLFYHHDKSN